jgi:hypothetical protein
MAALPDWRQRSTWRVDQRGLPLDGGWRANHSAGEISTPVHLAGAWPGTVSLATTPIRGVGGQWVLGDQWISQRVGRAHRASVVFDLSGSARC